MVAALTYWHWPHATETVESDPLMVEVVGVSRGDLVRKVRVTGSVTPLDTSHVVSKLSGRVTEFGAKVGQSVEAGQLIMRLDTTEVDAAVRQAQGALQAAQANHQGLIKGASSEEVDQARAAVDQARASYVAAEQAYARSRVLFEEGAISRQQYEGAKTQLEVSAAGLTMTERQLEAVMKGPSQELVDAARANVVQAQAAYDLALSRQRDAVIFAPISGVVAHTDAAVGDLVGAGMPVAVIIVVDWVYVEAGLAESLINWVEVGDKIPVTVRAATDQILWGDVTQLAPAADSRTRLFGMKVRLENPDSQLKSGMIAELDVPTDQVEQGLLVPRRAILTRGEAQYVFVIIEGVAERRRVRTGLYDSDWIEIIDGVTEGENIVVRGASYLEDGMAVRTQKVEEAP